MKNGAVSYVTCDTALFFFIKQYCLSNYMSPLHSHKEVNQLINKPAKTSYFLYKTFRNLYDFKKNIEKNLVKLQQFFPQISASYNYPTSVPLSGQCLT